MDHIHLKDHILVHKVGKCALVGNYTADFGCGKEYILRFFGFEKGLDIRLTGKVKLFVSPRYQIIVSLALKFAHYRAPDHSSVSRNVYLTVFVHLNKIYPRKDTEKKCCFIGTTRKHFTTF